MKRAALPSAHVASGCAWKERTDAAAPRSTACLERIPRGALAARAGTSQPAVSRYESGASSPSVETLDRLLAVMGARLDLVAEGAPRRLDVRTPRMVKLRQNRERIRRAPTGTGRRTSGSSGRSRADRPAPTLICWSTSMSGPGACSLWLGCRTSWLRCWGRGSKSSPRTRSIRTTLRPLSPVRCPCEPGSTTEVFAGDSEGF